MERDNAYMYEMNLKDLMFSVLHKWRVIILFAMICALGLGGYKGISVYRNNTSADAITETEEKYTKELLDYEKSLEKLEKEIVNIESNIEDQKEYMEKSIWLKVNPYDVCEARADIYVTTDYTIMPGMDYQNTDYTESILHIYRSLLDSSEVKEAISSKAGIESRYLNELLSVSRVGHILTISVTHVSKEEAQETLNGILAWVDELRPKVVAAIGEHTISVVNISTSASVDLDHVNKQEEQEDKLAALENELETKKAALKELVAPEREEFSVTTIIKSAVKFAVLGGGVGACAAAFFVCVNFLMSDKLYSAEELKKRYGVKVLGGVPAEGCKCPIDQWLNKFEGRKFELDENVRNGLIAQNVRNCIGEMKKLLVVGTADTENVEVLGKVLDIELSETIVVVGGNMLKDIETLKKLPECDGVILVEMCGLSKHSDIELEIERVKDLGKDIVGCVVIG